MPPPSIKSLVLLAFLAAGASALADQWQIVRFDGRDYIPLENIASFYGLPPPPPITATPGGPVAPASLPAAKNAPTAAPSDEPVFVPIESGLEKAVKLDNGKYELAFALESREAEINGVKQWLAFPTHLQDGKLLVSRLDLAKTIEPRLRPEKIEGLHAVTTVVLDPGHGGHDNGAPCRFGFEKNFALDVALRARALLEKQGLKVVMTRSADIFIPLSQRPAVANGIKDSIFVSIHFNSASSNSEARGFEIYSIAPRGAPATNDPGFSLRDLRDEPGDVVDTQSTGLAGTIFHSMLGNVPMQDRGLKHARFAVLRLCTQPAVLIECGFVSNQAESTLIGSPAWRQQVAASIVTGIDEYKGLAEQGHAPKMMAEYRRAAGP
jgi:N-acetylmuramoyl-L-alanine amidase